MEGPAKGGTAPTDAPDTAGGAADDLTDRGIAAALSTARAHGVRVTDPVILKDGANLVLHLWPAPVVARVATTTTLTRPGVIAWLARDLAMAAHLLAAGIPVVAPSDALPPGPHEADGMALTFLRFTPHDPDAEVDVAGAARMLADLHAALLGFGGEMPLLDPPLGEVERALDLLAARGLLSGEDAAALREAHARVADDVRAAAGPLQPLHGDAYVRNILVTEKGPVWADFEDCCAGPVAWDLACLLRGTPGDIPRALAAYGPAAPAEDELAPFIAARGLQALAWTGLVALRFPARRPDFADRLAAWRAGTA